MLKTQIEAILFGKGKKVSLDELKKLLENEDGRLIRKSINQLAKEYKERDTSLQVEIFSDGFKLSVKPDYVDIVRTIMPETEISKSVLETLSVIAWKYPNITQSEIINVRSSNAYDHLKDLERMGFIKREPMGRTKKITLTQKFFGYFDVENLDNFQKNLDEYNEFEDAFKAKQDEVKDQEIKIKTYNKLVKRVLQEESEKLQELETGDIDELLDKEAETEKITGVQVTLDESKSIDKDFLSKKINDELDKEFKELKSDENKLELDSLELDQKLNKEELPSKKIKIESESQSKLNNDN